MTKNNRFKKTVRAYQHTFGVSYMAALEAVSQPFIITPDMEVLVEKLRKLAGSFAGHGLVLITGRSGAGKTFLQHYLTRNLGSDLRFVEQDKEIEKYVSPLFTGMQENSSQEDHLGATRVSSNGSAGSVLVAGLGSELGRIKPDVVSLPEIRGNESELQVKEFIKAVDDTVVVASLHAMDPVTAFNRLERVLNDAVVEYGFDDFVSFVKQNVALMVDVDRVLLVDGKSLVAVSFFEVNENVVDVWQQGELKGLLQDVGYVSASVKVELMRNSL